MARETYVLVKLPTGKYDLVPKHLAPERPRGDRGPTIIKDIEPFINLATREREIISGRRQRRDMMRAHGLIEVGNEKLKQNKTAFPENRQDVVNDLKQAYRQHGVDVL